MELSRQPELSDEIGLLRKYLEGEAAPAGATKLRKDLRRIHRWKAERTGRVAGEAVAAGAVFAWPASRGGPRYWHREAGAFLRERILDAASELALPKKELAKRAARAAHSAGAKRTEAAIAELVRAGALRRVKAIVGGATLYHKAGAPEALLRASAEAFTAKFRALGMDKGEVAKAFGAPSAPAAASAAPPPAAEPGVAERALRMLRQLQEGPAVPVTVYRLRAAMPEASKPDLDRAVMALAADRRVYLTRHDHGWALPEDERDQLVHDGGANLYVAITLRE